MSRLVEVEDADGPPLFTFSEMMEHNGIEPPVRNDFFGRGRRVDQDERDLE